MVAAKADSIFRLVESWALRARDDLFLEEL